MVETIDVWLPAKFAQDHLDRCLPSGELIGQSHAAQRLHFRCNEEELREWISDSNHYSDCAAQGWDFNTRGKMLGMQSSARATNKLAKTALEKFAEKSHD